jgi:hypothetical protein
MLIEKQMMGFADRKEVELSSKGKSMTFREKGHGIVMWQEEVEPQTR